MQMFVDNGVAENDPRMAFVYEHYEQNLRDIIATLNAKGMHVVLSTVPVNLRQSAPFYRSMLRIYPRVTKIDWAGYASEQLMKPTEIAGERHRNC
jgi:hypothetical protein